jgi:hypothetical protein
LMFIGLEISHAIINKAKYDESVVESMEREITSPRNQDIYYKGSQDNVTKFIEDVWEHYRENE